MLEKGRNGKTDFLMQGERVMWTQKCAKRAGQHLGTATGFLPSSFLWEKWARDQQNIFPSF
jgi:hypothetical protein